MPTLYYYVTLSSSSDGSVLVTDVISGSSCQDVDNVCEYEFQNIPRNPPVDIVATVYGVNEFGNGSSNTANVKGIDLNVHPGGSVINIILCYCRC